MSTTTPRFGITIPATGDTDWASILIGAFDQLETTVGVNSNLVLNGNTADGAADTGKIVYLAGGGEIKAADISASRWGRAVLQEDMVNGDPALVRFLGITAIDGTVGSEGAAVFHSASAAQAVTDPKDAVLAAAGRIHFLPLGMSLAGGTMLFTGLVPVQTCPIIPGDSWAFFQDGTGAPTLTGWQTVYNNGEHRHFFESQFDGAAQDNDVVFAFTLPSDFGSFPNKAGASFWGLRVELRSNNNSASGYAGAQIVEFVDTAGNSFTSLGTALEQSTSWTTQTVSWQTLAGLGATLAPGGTVLMRVKTRGNNTDTVDVSNPSLQYFPDWRWN